MSLKVKTPYFGSFRMPTACVACGGSPGYGMNWIVKKEKSNWSGRRITTLSIQFPLCEHCYYVSRKKALANIVIVLGFLGALGLCLLTMLSPTFDVFENIAIYYPIGLVLFVTWSVLALVIVKAINQKGFTPEQKDRRKRVKRCAKICSFSAPGLINQLGCIVFEFQNPLFAKQFSLLNQGQIK